MSTQTLIHCVTAEGGIRFNSNALCVLEVDACVRADGALGIEHPLCDGEYASCVAVDDSLSVLMPWPDSYTVYIPYTSKTYNGYTYVRDARTWAMAYGGCDVTGYNWAYSGAGVECAVLHFDPRIDQWQLNATVPATPSTDGDWRSEGVAPRIYFDCDTGIVVPVVTEFWTAAKLGEFSETLEVTP